jgi:transglutaminase-like putative cysteine protease
MPGRLRRQAVIGGFAGLLAALTLGFYFTVPRPPAANLGAFPAGGRNDYDDRGWLEEATSPAGAALADGGGAGKAVPRESRPGKGADRVPGYGGFAERLDIDDPGREGGAGLFNGIVLYVQAARPLYLRGKVFDSFDGRTWQRSDPGTEKLALNNGAIRFMEDAGLPVIQQTVHVAHDLPGYLYGAERITALRFPGSVIARDGDRGLQVPGRLRPDTIYSVRSAIADAAGRPASGAEPLPDSQDYLQLPQHLSDRIGRLAAEVMRGERDMTAAARLERHLRTGYDYSFSTVVSSQGRIPLEEFLFETRRGHCEYFATAMVIMLRTQRIPARLATGFSATTYNPLTGYYEVRALDAHAWVEAWFPQHGWVLFEPTAFYSLPQPREASSTGRQLSEYLDDLARFREYLPEAGDEIHWGALVRGAYQGIVQFLQQLVFVIRHGAVQLAHGLWQFGPAVMLAAGLCGLCWHYLRYPWFRMRSRHRVRRARRTLPPQAFARLCYRELEALLTYVGCPRDPAWSVEEYIDRLRESDRRLAEPAARIARRFSRIRYAAQPPGFEPDRETLYRDYLGVNRLTPAFPPLSGPGSRTFLRRPRCLRLSVTPRYRPRFDER